MKPFLFQFRNLVFILTISFLSGSICSCKKDKKTESKTLTVGVLLGFSGTGSQNAKETKAALELCREDIKSKLLDENIDMQINLYIEDTQSDTTVAKEKIKLLLQKGVDLIIGPYTSSEAIAVKRYADSTGVLLVSHSAVSTALTIPGDNFLRFAPCDYYQAAAISRMFFEDTITAIFPIVRNDLWSNSLYAATAHAYTNIGGTCLPVYSFQPGTTSFPNLPSDISSAYTAAVQQYGQNHVGLYIISYGDGTNVLESLALTSLFSPSHIYGASAFAQHASLPANAAAGTLAHITNFQCPVFGFDENAAALYNPVQNEIINRIGTKASIYALAAYDILWVSALTASKREDNTSTQTFNTDFINTANSHSGLTGKTELDAFGDRRSVFYDFWGIEDNSGILTWKLKAKYNTNTQTVTRY